MEHPLVRPTLAPYKFAFSRQAKRLDYRDPNDPYYFNPEDLIARFWAKRHQADATRPLPIETIIHRILPGMARAHATFTAEFEFGGKPYRSRDIALLSTVVYWFGTNVGNAFLEPAYCWLGPRDLPPLSRRLADHPEREFLEKYRRQIVPHDYVKYVWAHTCVPECEKRRQPSFPADHCFYHDAVVPRDYAVVEGLMRWLGTTEGRTFTAAWRKRRNAAETHRQRQLMQSKQIRLAA